MTQKKIQSAKALENQLIVKVRNTQLAAALIAVGVQLRTDPPYTVHLDDRDNRITTWLFEDKSADGVYNTSELIKAWQDDVEFGEENPTHPFTFAMHAMKNYKKLVDHVKHQKPFVGYLSVTGIHTIWVVKGSKKEQECIRMGLKRTGAHAQVPEDLA